MKCIAPWSALVTLSAVARGAPDSQKSPVVTVQARGKIRVLAGERSGLMEIVLPDEAGAAEVPISSVPKDAKTRAGLWIPRVVQARWLPAEIEKKLGALKDVKLWEKRG